MTAAGAVVHTHFANAAIKVRKRFTYEQVSELYAAVDAGKSPKLAQELIDVLLRMRELALIFRARSGAPPSLGNRLRRDVPVS